MVRGDTAFKKLWLQYKNRTDPSSPPARQYTPNPAEATTFRAHTASAIEASTDEDDEYKRWKVLDPLKPIHPFDCERAFSEAGNLLKPDLIAALQCNRNYKRMSFKRTVKIGTAGPSSQPLPSSTPCQDSRWTLPSSPPASLCNIRAILYYNGYDLGQRRAVRPIRQLLEQILVITPKIYLEAWQAPKQASKRASFRLLRQASRRKASVLLILLNSKSGRIYRFGDDEDDN